MSRYAITLAAALRKGSAVLDGDEAAELDRDLIEGRQAVADCRDLRALLEEAKGLLLRVGAMSTGELANDIDVFLEKCDALTGIDRAIDDCSPVHPDDLDSPEASAARKGGE